MVRKSAIVNCLINKYKFKSYLEINKALGALAYNEVECENKVLCYLKEEDFPEYNLWKPKQEILALQSKLTGWTQIESYENILKYFQGKAIKFDVIFVDPIHIKTEVDKILKTIFSIVKEDGFLVMHDCNPPTAGDARKYCDGGNWCGETYKAFINFRNYNRKVSCVVNDDMGVGVVRNKNLNLGYDTNFDISYAEFDDKRRELLSLIPPEKVNEL